MALLPEGLFLAFPFSELLNSFPPSNTHIKITETPRISKNKYHLPYGVAFLKRVQLRDLMLLELYLV